MVTDSSGAGVLRVAGLLRRVSSAVVSIRRRGLVRVMALLLCALPALAAPRAWAATEVACLGRSSVVVRVLDPEGLLEIPAVDGAVFAQEVRELPDGAREVAISVTLERRLNRRSFRLPEGGLGDDPVGRLAAELARGCGYTHQVVEAVDRWIAENIDSVQDGRQMDDPAEVLARGAANCTGRSVLAVALLERLGIPAREVRGYLLPVDRWPDLRGGRFHRWIETADTGLGWLPGDAGTTCHFVPASRFVCRVADRLVSGARGPIRTLEDLGVRLEAVSRFRDILEWDRGGAGGPLRFFYPLDRMRRAGTIAGVVRDDRGRPLAGVTVRLRKGRTVRTMRATDAGRFSFPGLGAGVYTLSIDLRGQPDWTQAVQLGERTVVRREIIFAAELVAGDPAAAAPRAVIEGREF